MGKRALVSGITGQDGSYLAELLIGKGYEVHGIRRRVSVFTTERIEHLPEIMLHHGDLTDTPSLIRVLDEVRPDEIYHLAAQSHVAVSFEEPEYTAQADAVGTLRMLEAIRLLKLETRFYNASTSEIFGSSPAPQSELTPFHPCSPYGCAKLYSHHITVNYREAYGLWAVNGILFNHESPRRGETFVTRKITIGLNRLLNGYHDPLLLGNVRALRDWGHAKDYVQAMWLMLQQDKPEDYVIATGESRSVADFVTVASQVLCREVLWMGDDAYWDGQKIVAIHQKYQRPLEVPHLRGDASKARRQLGWAPKTTFTELVKEMLDADALRAPRVQMS